MRKPFAIPGKIVLLVLAGVAIYAFWRNSKKAEAVPIEGDMEELRKYFEDKVPTGTKSLKYTVTTEVMHVKLSPAWISLSMINDGDSDVYISTTDEHDLSDQVAVKKNETININMDYPVIREIWLKSDGSAVCRIHGKEGRNV